MAKKTLLDRMAEKENRKKVPQTPEYPYDVTKGVNDPDKVMWPNGEYATTPDAARAATVGQFNDTPQSQQTSKKTTTKKSKPLGPPADADGSGGKAAETAEDAQGATASSGPGKPVTAPGNGAGAAAPSPAPAASAGSAAGAASESPAGTLDAMAQQAIDQANANADTITGIYDKAAADVKQAADKYGDDLAAANAVVDQSGLTYSDLLQKWELEREKMIEEAEAEAREKEKNNYNTQVFGGLTEVAANIANLIGTAHGAFNQPIASQQDKWWERADAVRREHEQRRERYRSQLENIRNQRAQLQYQIGQRQADGLRQVAQARQAGVSSSLQYQTQGALAAQQARDRGQQNATNLQIQAIRQRQQDEAQKASNALQWARLAFDKQKFNESQQAKADAAAAKTAGRGTITIDGQEVDKPTPEEIMAIQDILASKMGYENNNDYKVGKAKRGGKGDKTYRNAKKNMPSSREALEALNNYSDDKLEQLSVNRDFVDALNEVRGNAQQQEDAGRKAEADDNGFVSGDEFLDELLGG